MSGVGSDDAFHAFCVEAHPRLVAALGHVVGDHAVAEELAQEALVRAHQRWRRVSQLESPLGWTGTWPTSRPSLRPVPGRPTTMMRRSDVSADLRDLLERTAAAPSTPVDPVRIASRSRRRSRRRRGGAGLTGAALALPLAVVAWPGVGPGGLIIEDRVADQPGGSDDAGTADGEVARLDLPEGWQQVEVGDASFGVPADRDTRELAPSDGSPCHNGLDRVRTYLAPDGYPTGVVACRQPLPDYTSLLAAPLSTVPELVREQRHGTDLEPAPRPTAVTLPSGIHGQRVRVGGNLETYAFPQVDLWLEFHNVEQEPVLIEQVLATVAAVERG
ncbi:sigma factor [Nitriliruptor alkaliphilus]|uniref:sigma factor n=1 Tax=Nitriliruptor alkaliphilus TaxID=427918 RepID=UPI000695A660|nr:sigma factor [Nitriliruptor alkaliphilus]